MAHSTVPGVAHQPLQQSLGTHIGLFLEAVTRNLLIIG